MRIKETIYSKGSATYLVLLAMAGLLMVGIGLSGLLVEELKGLREAEDSVLALAAADAGVEKTMYAYGVLCYINPDTRSYWFDQCLAASSGTDFLANGSEYTIELYNPGAGVPVCVAGASGFCVHSEGKYIGALGESSLRKVEAIRND
jgi:hypothetical protein